MTRSANPDATFQTFGSYKWEVDRELFEAFTEACAYLEVKKVVIIRMLMTEFVDTVRAEMAEEAKGE